MYYKRIQRQALVCDFYLIPRVNAAYLELRSDSILKCFSFTVSICTTSRVQNYLPSTKWKLHGTSAWRDVFLKYVANLFASAVWNKLNTTFVVKRTKILRPFKWCVPFSGQANYTFLKKVWNNHLNWVFMLISLKRVQFNMENVRSYLKAFSLISKVPGWLWNVFSLKWE